MANDSSSRWFSSPQGIAAAWAGILAGPIAWALDLGVSYALVQWTCGSRHAFVLRLVTVGSLALVAAGGYAAWRAFEQAPAGASIEGGQPHDRGRFMAIWGLWTCAFFAIVIVATAIPRWILDACQ